MVKYQIAVEVDNTDPGMCMVVIRNANSLVIVGVPVRGVTLEAAREMLAPLRYAFQYGISACAEHVKSAVYSYVEVEEKRDA